MRFITVRDLRGKSAEVWAQLAQETYLVITNNGKAIALLSKVSEETLEETVVALRRARAEAATASMQLQSVREGRHELPLAQINAEIAEVRKKRSR